MMILMILMISTAISTATALEIDLVHRGDGAYDDMKCVSEDIHANAVVLFAFETVLEGDKVSVKVFDAKGEGGVGEERRDERKARIHERDGGRTPSVLL